MANVKSQRSRRQFMQDVLPELQIERIANDDSKLLESFAVGDVSHQGDIILIAIARLPKSIKPRRNRQLAEGDTQGSRHVLQRGEIYDAPAYETAAMIMEASGCRVDEQYVGPVFVAPQAPTADDLTHPEHGNQGFPAGTVCAVVFQRNLDAEEREQRTQD